MTHNVCRNKMDWLRRSVALERRPQLGLCLMKHSILFGDRGDQISNNKPLPSIIEPLRFHELTWFLVVILELRVFLLSLSTHSGPNGIYTEQWSWLQVVIVLAAGRNSAGSSLGGQDDSD